MLRSPLLLALAFAGLCVALRAEPAPGEAEVSAVRFRLARPASGANEPWLEAEVETNARPGPANPGRMLPRVRVTLTLCVETLAGNGPRRLDFYRASAEAVALDEGRSSIRFYLPPEIVRRDGVRSEPRWWLAEVAVGGRPMPAGRGRFSSALANEQIRRDFLQKVAANASGNDGVLQPQYLTPFATDHPNETPTYVRRDRG